MCYTRHKCQSRDCDNIISQEEVFCESCLNKLGELVEQHPLGFVPSKFKS